MASPENAFYGSSGPCDLIETPAKAGTVAGANIERVIFGDRAHGYLKARLPAIICYQIDASLTVTAFAIVDRLGQING